MTGDCKHILMGEGIEITIWFYEVDMKTLEPKRAIKHLRVCDTCYEFYKRNHYLLENKEQEEKWLSI